MRHDRLAAHVLRALAVAHARRRQVDLDQLVEILGVRRADVRAVVSQLHREGHVDALKLRLTLSGLALATSFSRVRLADVREASVESDAIVAA